MAYTNHDKANDSIIAVTSPVTFDVEEGKTYTVSAIESFDAFSGSFSFDADSACIAVKDNSLFIGRDGKISRIDIIHR